MTGWSTSGNRLTRFKIAWLGTGVVVSVYLGVLAPLERSRSISENRANGLASVSSWQGLSLSGSPTYKMSPDDKARAGARPQQLAAAAFLETKGESAIARKLVQTISLEMIVKNPDQVSSQVNEIASRLGGWVENSQVNNPANGSFATSCIRVPASRADEARAEIRKLAIHVDSEQTDSKDVTKAYVDQDARLRNLRAQEEQYLAIMKRAVSVKDTLDVTEKLNGVRGEIEEQQAEFTALAKHTETVSITVSLRADADAQVFGVRWRPLYELKLAARQGLEGLSNYLSSIAVLLFFLPTILLWAATILLGAALGWRIFSWAVRRLFVTAKAV